MDENQFFREATLRICGSLDIQEALDAFLEYARAHIRFDHVSVSYFKEDEGRGVVVASSHREGEPFIPFLNEAAYSETERDGLFEIMETGPPVLVIEDLSTAEPIVQTLCRRHFGFIPDLSCLLMTLTVGDELLGLLILTSTAPVTFSDREIELLTLLQPPFSVSMANWRKHLVLLEHQETLRDDCRFFQCELRDDADGEVVGATGGLKQAMGMAARVARTDSPVLILGETGVGKEVVANAIHNASDRRDGPFIKVNCGAIHDSLLDSELFGHEKGAFTGATKDHKGRFERASGGTIFLDEVGELPHAAQVRLLRVLQNQEIERVGGVRPVKVDVRVISATHRNLEAMVAQGSFRKDLWFRLNVFPVTVPPLRQRKGDIPALVRHFVGVKQQELKLSAAAAVDDIALGRLVAYDWPGNVRELQNVVEREMILRPGGRLLFDGLVPVGDTGEVVAAEKPRVEPLDVVTRRAMERALKAAGGRVQGRGGAAELLQVKPNTLRARMKKLGVDFGIRWREETKGTFTPGATVP